MDLVAFAKTIEHLDYVVMRNWETMPPDGDIDFFVAEHDKEELKAMCLKYLKEARWYDVRSPGDHYFSPKIEQELLAPQNKNQRIYNGFKIPSRNAHFLSLYYHNLVHKGDGRYDQRLKELFWDWMKPIRANDSGVEYHDPR